jgi:hypothetical protein
MGDAGTPIGKFQRALRSGSYLAALAAAHDVPSVRLRDAIELTLLAAEKDPPRYLPMALRCVCRLCEVEDASLTELAWLAQLFADVEIGKTEPIVARELVGRCDFLS